ncbi:uncharacterized protein isoform X1 [Castor canadensis]|uniref:Uncharacterized protein isoform X1 n=2 Tax=Castor canadensis TaxID=51338 RepID=A0AC58LU18_CASCN
MDPGWTLLLLLLASIAVSPPGLAVATGTREKLCGHHFLRALVRACGGPRWAPESGHGHPSPAAGITGVSCSRHVRTVTVTLRPQVTCGWRDVHPSDRWLKMDTSRWDPVPNPVPRVLTATATAAQPSPTPHTAAAWSAAPRVTCWGSVPTDRPAPHGLGGGLPGPLKLGAVPDCYRHPDVH